LKMSMFDSDNGEVV